jgi:hypothetical protein
MHIRLKRWADSLTRLQQMLSLLAMMGQKDGLQSMRHLEFVIFVATLQSACHLLALAYEMLNEPGHWRLSAVAHDWR